MTVKKAIKTLNYFIEQKNKHLEIFSEIEDVFSSKDTFELADQLRKNLDSELVILGMIQTQLIPKCRHPKKYRDKMKNGTLYCMNYNVDL